MIKTLTPPLQACWFLIDITRKIGNLSRLSVDFCLTAESSANATVRARALVGIVATSRSSMASEYRALIIGLPERLLQLRLEPNLKLDWKIVDTMILDILTAEEVPLSTCLMHSALSRLGTSDEGLEVSMPLLIAHFLILNLHVRTSFSHMCAILYHEWVPNFAPSPRIDCGRWRKALSMPTY